MRDWERRNEEFVRDADRWDAKYDEEFKRRQKKRLAEFSCEGHRVDGVMKTFRIYPVFEDFDVFIAKAKAADKNFAADPSLGMKLLETAVGEILESTAPLGKLVPFALTVLAHLGEEERKQKARDHYDSLLAALMRAIRGQICAGAWGQAAFKCLPLGFCIAGSRCVPKPESIWCDESKIRPATGDNPVWLQAPRAEGSPATVGATITGPALKCFAHYMYEYTAVCGCSDLPGAIR